MFPTGGSIVKLKKLAVAAPKLGGTTVVEQLLVLHVNKINNKKHRLIKNKNA